MTMIFGTTPPYPHQRCVVCHGTRWGCINGVWECLDCRDKKAKAK